MIKLLGSILLIAGSCIGAGMLGLPVATGASGLLPTIVFFLGWWIYALLTGLLLLEAYLWYENREINLITLASDTLGKWGKIVVITSFIFLFYCLMIAYISEGGQIVARILPGGGPVWLGMLLLTLFTMLIISFGTWQVDIFNRAGMLGLVVTYVYLLSLTPGHAKNDLLLQHDYSSFLFVVPFLVISFGFHNMVATINNYLERKANKVAIAIKFGSFLPLVIYLLWILAVFLVVPLKGDVSLSSAYRLKQIATEPLALLTDPSIRMFASFFSFFALITSMFGQSLSVVDFLRNVVQNSFIYKRWHYVLLFFVPCYLLAYLEPKIFYKALEYAGGLAATILFGFLPGLIVWRGRYSLALSGNKGYRVFGGKPLLLLVMAIGLGVFMLEFLKVCGIVDLTPALYR